MGKGAKGKIQNVRDADVAKFPGVDGTLSPGMVNISTRVYEPLTATKVKTRVDRIRLEGKVPRQVENYFRTFKPDILGKKDPHGDIITEERILANEAFRGPARHSWDSKMQIQEVEDRYRGVSKYPSPEPRIKGMPEGTTYPLPAGVPFTMSFLTFLEDPRYGVTTTVDNLAIFFDRFNTEEDKEFYVEVLINLKVFYERTNVFWRTYLMTKVIPHMGNSIQRDATSRFGLIEHYVLDADGRYAKDAHGRKVVERVVCECGGNFRRDEYGDAVCTECGLILEGDLTVVEPEDESDTTERTNFYSDDAYTDKETSSIPTLEDIAAEDGTLDAEVAAEYIRIHNELEDARANREVSIGGAALSGALGQREYNVAAFEARLRNMVTTPAEVKAKERAHSDKQGHREAIKASRKTRKHAAHEVYEGKWYAKRTSYQTYRILVAVRDMGITNLRELYKLYPDMDAKLVYRRLEELVTSGRITMVDNGKSGKGKQVTLAYTGKPVVHTFQDVITVPVLLQVQYGGYQKQTINARRH